jgi:hypothetical protein
MVAELLTGLFEETLHPLPTLTFRPIAVYLKIERRIESSRRTFPRAAVFISISIDLAPCRGKSLQARR